MKTLTVVSAGVLLLAASTTIASAQQPPTQPDTPQPTTRQDDRTTTQSPTQGQSPSGLAQPGSQRPTATQSTPSTRRQPAQAAQSNQRRPTGTAGQTQQPQRQSRGLPDEEGNEDVGAFDSRQNLRSPFCGRRDAAPVDPDLAPASLESRDELPDARLFLSRI